MNHRPQEETVRVPGREADGSAGERTGAAAPSGPVGRSAGRQEGTHTARPQEEAHHIPAQYIILRLEDGYRWQLFSPERRLLCVSYEAFDTLRKCRASIEQVRTSCTAAVNLDPIEEASE